MDNENSYINQLENYTDDELFEIIANPSETDNAPRYVAAVSIALKRELISEYQSMELLDGNTTILDYNPNNIEKGVEDYTIEEEIRVNENEKGKIGNIKYGLILIGLGVVMLIFALSGDSFFPAKTKIVAAFSIIVGCLILLIGFIDKIKKRQKDTL